MIRRVRIRVYGQVQGVAFRASARMEAQRMGLAGFARNEADGSVTIEVEGPADAVTMLLAWCAEGPPAARVIRIETEELPVTGTDGFKIAR